MKQEDLKIVADKLLEQLTAKLHESLDRAPEDWAGREVHWLLYEKVREILPEQRGPKFSEFKNDYIVRNL